MKDAQNEALSSGPADRIRSKESGGRDLMDALQRHWEAVLDYATVCTTSPVPATRLAGTALMRTGDDLSHGATAGIPWRPRLLATVRQVTHEWNRDERGYSLQPALRTGALAPRTDRQLLLRAFEWLPDRAQVLLWHTEVEAEDITHAAALAGVAPAAAQAELAADRGRLRAGCRQMHIDLAPDDFCRRYSGLIEAVTRRPDAQMPPDLRRHLDQCSYCRTAVDQLDHSGQRLPLLLAEAVLGYGATTYITIRQKRRIAAQEVAPTRPDSPSSKHTPSPFLSVLAQRTRQRFLSPVLIGIAVTATIAVALIRTVSSPESMATPPPASPAPAPSSAPPASTASPPPRASDRPPIPSPSSAEVAQPDNDLLIRFQNTATDLCLTHPAAATAGSAASLERCSGSADQLWRLDDQKRLHLKTRDELCLGFQPYSFRVQLTLCRDKRLDRVAPPFQLTPQGLLAPRHWPSLAVTPTGAVPGSTLVLQTADLKTNAPLQRWRATRLRQQ